MRISYWSSDVCSSDLTAVPASALGALLYVRLESDLVQGLLGAILIASVPLRRWTAGRLMEPSRPTVIAVSGAFGFLSSIIVGAGLLVLPILMGFGLAGPALLATDAARSEEHTSELQSLMRLAYAVF